MTELKDKRMEAASDIEHAGSGYFRTRAERFDQILTTALRVTGADELAEALGEVLRLLKLDPFYDHYPQPKANAALDRYKKLKNG